MMKIEIQDGCMKVDPIELFHALTDEQKTLVARMIAFDEHMIDCVCQMIATGTVDWADGYWSMWSTGKDNTCLDRARQRLLPLMPEIMRTFVTELINQRDAADKREKQWRDHCFELRRRWSDSKMPDDRIDYSRPPKLTAEQVETLIQQWESKDTQ